MPISDINLVNEGEDIFVKNLGEKIQNNNTNYKEIFANSWIYNTSTRFQVTGDTTLTLRTPIDKSSLKVGDTFEMLKEMNKLLLQPLTSVISMLI